MINPPVTPPITAKRMHIIIRGAVQGVGFRPFIYCLAQELALSGWVNNSTQGVFIEAEGPSAQLEEFVRRIQKNPPPLSRIEQMEISVKIPQGDQTFVIHQSDDSGSVEALILPDMATCPDCIAEIFSSTDRRYRYPFTNCTHCGPRFSIIQALPYDRPNTTMKNFALCLDCQKEYKDPINRRFHAQPIACPNCGPWLEWWDLSGQILASREDALTFALNKIRQGQIVAVKGLGGFHLMADPFQKATVNLLRQRKNRPHKPFALMFPSVEQARQYCKISPQEEKLLLSPQAPIVLLKCHQPIPGIAPGLTELGVMIPYTPLHHLLLTELNQPVIATSGNRADEPICTDEYTALKSLGHLADGFLVHNRPIVLPVDDSIVRVIADRETILRRARGYAPLPIRQNQALPSLMALGSHMKNTVAFSLGQNLFISQHLGDLDTVETIENLKQVIEHFKGIYHLKPKYLACDRHPDYASTKYGYKQGVRVYPVQHHHAHVLSCMVDNGLSPPVFGVAWDGTGYGNDEIIWGGEWLYVTQNGFQRVAHFQNFPLPGGERAIQEPRRSALGLLYSFFGEAAFEQPFSQSFTLQQRQALQQMLKNQLNSPLTASAGRLFDAVAAILGLCLKSSFEGQAAMQLEAAIGDLKIQHYYPFELKQTAPIIINFKATIQAMLEAFHSQIPLAEIAAAFHNTLVEVIVAISRPFQKLPILLTGGCFQNKYLAERTIQRLHEEGFTPYWHHQIPPNDGGISIGQLMAAIQKEEH